MSQDRDSLTPTNGHSKDQVHVADMQPEPTLEYLAGMVHHIAVKQVLEQEERSRDMRELGARIRLWNALPLLELSLAGLIGGAVAAAIAVGTVVALLGGR